jgi:membrane fusion protein, multidrug efflux system
VSCHQKEEKREEKKKLIVTKPLRKSVDVTKEYVAQIRAHQHIEVRAMEHGYLQGTFVDEGQRITAGHRMFQLLPVIYQAEVQEAQAEVDRAEIEYNNTKTLSEKNIVSTQELSLAKATLSKANAKLNLATTHRSLTDMHAPFSGIVGRFQARQGSLIDEGDLLTTLSDNTKIWVYFNVSETEYLNLKKKSPDLNGIEVKLRLANGDMFDQRGAIETVEADFDNETGTIAFRAGFKNPDGLLRHGETGKVLIENAVADALLIPQKATFEVLEKRFVFVVDEHNVVHSRAVAIAADLPQLYVVSGGLKEDDRILVDGLRKVHDGSDIEPDEKDPTELFKTLQVAAE